MGRCVGAFIHATPFPDLQHLVKFHFLPLPGRCTMSPKDTGGFRDRATFLKQKKWADFLDLLWKGITVKYLKQPTLS